ncbi:ComEC/Rec2 family competence protein [Ancylobacter sp. G4_0304]|uniref:ComEC/Rec2 family competence protein n=1 Tax=Ancylobacter sp. G4_0304 TaxID=3114289 RepID=UPI0039C640B1
MAAGGEHRPEQGSVVPARIGARAAGEVARGPVAGLPFLPEGLAGRLPAALGAALAHEVEDRRGFLYAVIGFGLGVALYFGAEYEPMAYVALLPAGLIVALAWLARARAGAFHLFALAAAISCGFAVASLQVQRLAHPVLAQTLTAVKLSGFVEARERRPRGSRITLQVTGIERRLSTVPERVRVTLATRDPPAIGSHVTLRATLSPPPGASWPGGFDFGRAAWFDGIGATGFALGKAQESAAPGPVPLSLRLAAWLDARRNEIAARITASVPGAAGGIAVALVTGLRDAVPEPIEESMRISGLSHVLSISGLHMALVATTVFFLVRALLALFPPLALRYPIKAWAAVPAALAATYYLVLSGAEVPTQRSYVMTLLVLAGVIATRPALTLRTLALAALAVLVLTPWAILDPGAQMSFAATLALVAAYQRFGDRLSRPAGAAVGGGIAGMPARYVAALALTSLAAGLATAPYAAFHFHRLAPLSLIANLAATPLVSFIIMPAGLIGCLLMPFGWDGAAWWAMGWGIDAMVAVSNAVAALPGADSGIRAMPAASMILLSGALIVLCLARSWLIVLAPAMLAGALWLGARAPLPDVLVDTQARTVAVRGTDGRLHVMGDRDARLERRFAVEQWRGMEGERATTAGAAPDLYAPRCDAEGCTLETMRGARVALSRRPDSLADDCRLAALVVTSATPPKDCAAQVLRIDPRRQIGGVALYADEEGGWRVETARPEQPRRLWHPGFGQADARALAKAEGATPSGETATPREAPTAGDDASEP